MENTILDQDYQTNDFVNASSGKRLANYLIDLLLFYVVFIAIGILAVIAGFDIDSIDNMNPIVERLFSAFLLAIYYFVLETSLKGKTIGKYITKTRSVQVDGSYMTPSQTLKRSFSRIVPFEVFSFLGDNPPRGWHDKWSDSKVIDETKQYRVS